MSRSVGPLTGGGEDDRRVAAVGAGRAFVISASGTAVAVAAWAGLFELPALMDSFGALMIFAVPPLLAALVGAATARWGDGTIVAAIAGALGGWLACAALPHLLTLVGSRVDPNAYAGWLIAAGTAGLLAYAAGFAAGWWLSTR